MNRVHRWLCASAAWGREVERRIVPWVLDGVSLDGDLLEVGPGPGLTTNVLRTRVARVTALEVDRRLAAALHDRLRGLNVRVVEGDGSRMPFGGDGFSAVVSFTMLHHVPSPTLQDQLFGESYRVLKPGGCLAGTDNVSNWAFRLLHIGDTLVPIDPRTLADRLEAAGFRDVTIDGDRRRFRFRAYKPIAASADS